MPVQTDPEGPPLSPRVIDHLATFADSENETAKAAMAESQQLNSTQRRSKKDRIIGSMRVSQQQQPMETVEMMETERPY